MELLQINDNNFDELQNYIKSFDLTNHLDFYKLEDKNEYYCMIKKIATETNSISLLMKENDFVVGFMIGEVESDELLKSKVAVVKYSLYDDLSCYEKLLEKFQSLAKNNNCEYVSVCTPNFQKDALNLLKTTGFSSHKVELEKELI